MNIFRLGRNYDFQFIIENLLSDEILNYKIRYTNANGRVCEKPLLKGLPKVTFQDARTPMSISLRFEITLL